MSGNLTFQQQLVQDLPLSGFLSSGKPVGRQGFAVIVVERIGTGFQYYCTLAPGDTLRVSERMFGKFSAYIVDMRSARILDINEQIPTANPLIKVRVTARVLYGVADAKRVALEVEDPLAKFRDRIVGILRRELSQLTHQKINELVCERAIYGVGTVSHLGLAVEGVDLITVEHDSRVIKGLEQRAELDYNTNLGRDVDDDSFKRTLRKQQQEQELKKQQLEGELYLKQLQQQAEMQAQRAAIDGFDLTNVNTLLHLRPELTQEIITRLSERERHDFDHDNAYRNRLLSVIDTYIKNNEDANPEDMMRLIREASMQSRNINPRILFGTTEGGGMESRVKFGTIIEGQALPPPRPSAGDPDDDDA